ncbi:hypothetical protein B0H13DRAFT_1897766 [Mycena leptocephala]|nr:hypothetical protein B0H13DRAFT_1897766 [Mycena leptocephala]
MLLLTNKFNICLGNIITFPVLPMGGTLSECAARECKGATFHFGNVPGLAPTTLGKDTCLFFNRAPPLFLLPPPPLTPNGHQRVENASKCPPTAPTTRSIIPPLTNPFLTSIDRLPCISYQIQDSAALPVGLAVGDSKLNGIRMARPPNPGSKAEYHLGILALIAFDQEDEGRVKSSPLSVDNYRDTEDRNVGYTLVQISMNFGWFQSRLSFNTQAPKERFAANMICLENCFPFKISSVPPKAAIHPSRLDLGILQAQRNIPFIFAYFTCTEIPAHKYFDYGDSDDLGTPLELINKPQMPEQRFSTPDIYHATALEPIQSFQTRNAMNVVELTRRPTRPTECTGHAVNGGTFRECAGCSPECAAPSELGNDSPDMAVKRVVDEEWKSFIQQRPLNAVYFGYQREDGQVVHDLVNLNAIQVLYNKEDGRPCTLTGHLYSHLVQSPSITSTVWPLEVPYPSDARIQQVMDQFRPLDRRSHESSSIPDNPVDAETDTTSVHSSPAAIDSVSNAKTYYEPWTHREIQSALHNNSVMQAEESRNSVDERSFLQYPDDESNVDSSGSQSMDACERCGQPQHDRIDYCPSWVLPVPASTAYPTPRDSPAPLPVASQPAETAVQNETILQENGSSVTVQETVPSATINPVVLNLQNMTREELIMQNLHHILGLDPTEPRNLTKLQDVARVAEQQAHEAYLIISRHLHNYYPDSDLAMEQGTDPQPFNLMMGLRPDTVSGSVDVNMSQNGNTVASIGPNLATDHRASTNSSRLFSSVTSASELSPDYSPIDTITGSPITEQSVKFDYDDYDPREIINDAVRRVVTEPFRADGTYISPNRPMSVTFPSLTAVDEETTDEESSIDTNDFLAAVEGVAGFSLQFQNVDGTDASLGAELFQWAEDQMEREDFTRRWDSGFGGEPWHNARQAAYHSLRPLLDFTQMAAEQIRNLSSNPDAESAALGDLSTASQVSPSSSNDGISHSQNSVASMEVSMEASATQVPPSSTLFNGDVDPHGPERGVEEFREERGAEGRGDDSAERPRKRFRKFRGDDLRRIVTQNEGIKASHLAEPGVLGFLAYVRRGLLEGGRRVEAFLVREKCDFRAGRRQYFEENKWLIDIERDPQKFTSCRRLRHPLLFDLEAAKLQVLFILLRQRDYNELAWVLGDLLHLKFRDEYAIAHLLGAGYLDYVPPDLEAPGLAWKVQTREIQAGRHRKEEEKRVETHLQPLDHLATKSTVMLQTAWREKESMPKTEKSGRFSGFPLSF